MNSGISAPAVPVNLQSEGPVFARLVGVRQSVLDERMNDQGGNVHTLDPTFDQKTVAGGPPQPHKLEVMPAQPDFFLQRNFALSGDTVDDPEFLGQGLDQPFGLPGVPAVPGLDGMQRVHDEMGLDAFLKELVLQPLGPQTERLETPALGPDGHADRQDDAGEKSTLADAEQEFGRREGPSEEYRNETRRTG